MKTLQLATVCLLGGTLGWAQATDLRVVSVTAQQAVVQYGVPDASACALSVADNSGQPVTVWDVSSAKFAGSNLDLSRQNTTVLNGGSARQVVVGARLAQAASDGKLYSRSLQANTSHTLTVNCTAGSASVTFKTLNPPVGATYPDPQPYDPAGFGNAGWPTVNWSNRNQVYIDPKTGIALRPATWWGSYGVTSNGIPFASAWEPTGTWTGAANVLNSASGALASTSGTNPLYVSLSPGIPTGNGIVSAGGFTGYTVSDLRIRIRGSGSAANAADRTVNLCIYSHTLGACDTPVQTITLNQTNVTTVQYPASNWPSAPFTAWGGTTWAHNLVAPFSATVNVSGSTVTSTASVPYDGANGRLFNTDLVAGDKVLINGALATIQSVTSPTSMIIQEDLGTLAGVTLTAANFGVRIAKATANGTVNVAAAYDLALETTPGFFIADGASSQCSSNTFDVTENAAGAQVAPVPGRLCVFRAPTGETSVHLLIPSTGEMREIGIVKIGYGGDCTDCFAVTVGPRVPYDPFDTSDPRAFYVEGYSSSSRLQVIKISYRGSGKTYGPQYVDTNFNFMWAPTDGESVCRSGETQSGNLCMAWVTQPSTHDLVTMAKAADPRIAAGLFGNSPIPIQVLHGKMILYMNLQQDAATAFIYLDLASSGITRVTDSFSSPGARWGAMHTASAWTAGGTYHAAIMNPLGRGGATGAMIGPYSSTVTALWNSTDGITGTWNSNTGFNATYSYPCPASACGAQVNNTLRFRVAGTACSAYPSAAEKASYPCPWNSNYSALSTIQPGDLVGNCAQSACKGSELMKVLRVVQNSPTDWDLWVLRGVSSPGGNLQQVSGNGWSISMFPSNSCDSALFWYDVTGTDGTVHSDDCSVISGAHVDIVSGPDPGTYTFTKATAAKYGVPATSGGFVEPVQNNLNGFGTWAQLTANINFPGNGNVEMYPSLRHFFSAPASERVWAADYRAILGGSFTAPNGGTESISGNALTQVTTGGRTKVWRFAPPYPVTPKLLPIDAFAGRWYFHDISGPGSNVTDATPFSYCVVYQAGECIVGGGTTAGEIYFAAPKVVNMKDGTCWTNQMDSQIPCFIPASPIGDWALQWDVKDPDPTGFHFRRLSQAFAGASRVTTAPNWRPTPEGKWGFLFTSYADGVAPMMWIMTVPPWPGYDSVRRDNFIYRPVQLGAGADLAEIRFGYEENGDRGQFFCTTRQDGCASRADSRLFNFVNTDGHAGASCTSGCTINVPAISGRLLWWQEFRSADHGATWTANGQQQLIAVP